MNDRDNGTLQESASPIFWLAALLFVLLAIVPLFDHRFTDPVTADNGAEERTEEKSLVTE